MNKKEFYVKDGSLHVTTFEIKAPTHMVPIVLVHGSWGGEWMWDSYAEYLTLKGWKTYALDLRGHGKSKGSVEGVKMEDYVSDISAVVEEQGLKNPIVIGHSMGGLVALMYGNKHTTSGVVSIDGSPSLQAQEEGIVVVYPAAYTPMDAGMPTDPQEAMGMFPDLSMEQIMGMRDMFGKESGVARSERKLGIDIPKENLQVPLLFMGAEFGTSVPFGIGIKTSRKMGKYYNSDIVEIKGATHPGILMGSHTKDGSEAITTWLQNNGII